MRYYLCVSITSSSPIYTTFFINVYGERSESETLPREDGTA